MKKTYAPLFILFFSLVFAVAAPLMALAADFSVSIANYAFTPATTTIKQGDRVVWTNNATTSHTAIADSGIFRSAVIQSGQTYAYTFSTTTPGTYRYYDQTFGARAGVGMSGTIVVTSVTTSPPPPAPPPTPTPASEPYQFKNEGIFGCNVISGANSAGAMAAIGGVYVPVNDAAITLNTGILTYKECILRPLQDRLREAATSALFKKAVLGVESGREGNKQYVVDIDDELQQVDDKAALTYLTGAALNTVNPAFRDIVKRALAVNVRVEAVGTGKQDCGYVGDLKAGITGLSKSPLSFGNLETLSDPSCNPYFAYLEKKEELTATRAEAQANQMKVWDWGGGFYAKTDNAPDPLAEKILTPASVIRDSFQQILGSPVRQLESADDIGQMIGALFSSATTQALTDTRGLAGLTQSVAGQPSYLEQIARESSQGVVGAAVNAALSILNASRQVEGSYLAAMTSIASSLTSTIQQLRATENRCWDLVVPKVREYAGTQTCATNTQTGIQTCTGGFELDPKKIAASTSSLAFSQQVIDSQVAPLANASVINVQAAQRALALIDQLIAGVTNTTSVSAQRLALQQLDTLVAARALHTSYDAQNAAKQRDDVAAAMANLITDTARAWGDSTDLQVGWCNVNNQSVISAWAERWKR